MTSSSPRRPAVGRSFSGRFDYTQNTLTTAPNAETLTLASNGHIPGYQGHLPGDTWVIGQRRAAASHHAAQAMAETKATGDISNWNNNMLLVEQRPEQRTNNKNYMYAETSQSTFLKFPSAKELDHRKL